jgi:hypothetical protein
MALPTYQLPFIPGPTVGVVASAAFTSGKFITYASAAVASQGVLARGVSLQDAEIGDSVSIAVGGQAPMITNTDVATHALTVGMAITSAADGTVMRATTGDEILGRSLSASSTAGQWVVIEFHREGVA